MHFKLMEQLFEMWEEECVCVCVCGLGGQPRGVNCNGFQLFFLPPSDHVPLF